MAMGVDCLRICSGDLSGSQAIVRLCVGRGRRLGAVLSCLATVIPHS
jgi:hypothetical protein